MATKKTPATKRRQLTDAEKAARAKEQAAKFQELANKRVPKALKQIALVGNLSGSGYKHTTEQVEKIGDALQNAVDKAMARFETSSKSEEDFQV